MGAVPLDLYLYRRNGSGVAFTGYGSHFPFQGLMFFEGQIKNESEDGANLEYVFEKMFFLDFVSFEIAVLRYVSS